MSFYILSAANTQFEVDSSMIKTFTAGKLGKPAITVSSEYVKYENSVLSIITEIIFGGFMTDMFHPAVHSSYISDFEIAPDLLLSDKNFDPSIALLMKCHELAQAHAFGIYVLLCKEHSLPLTGMDKTPTMKYDYKAETFLEKIRISYSLN
ncbi:hypothetical protein [Dyadobacter sp. CY326]|uniref:hypothetical protein n=1 Tax=Dyadobacter sp. CY326 TaxID=2907300 RepID=UPI001F261E1E|nr:hypothetical protein [Dyadobacter sp. CY326]MCE7065805.1 hypothetical protein [Dyadobacter sp. CY326]